MKNKHAFKDLMEKYVGIGFLIFAVLISATAAYSHGGKHAGAEFTHLQALQKAAQLYDELIGNGKLGQSWETDLKKITISNRLNGDKQEVVVSFHLAEGDPKTVYIFFTASGKYAGSNFTGE